MHLPQSEVIVLTEMARIYQTMRKTESARINQTMCKTKRKMDWLHPDHGEKKMDWFHPDHGENKNELVSSRPCRKEKWTGCIQTIENLFKAFTSVGCCGCVV